MSAPTSLYAMDAWIRGYNHFHESEEDPEDPGPNALMLDQMFYVGWKAAVMKAFGECRADRLGWDTAKIVRFIRCEVDDNGEPFDAGEIAENVT